MNHSFTRSALFLVATVSLLVLGTFTPVFAQRGVSTWLNEVRKGRSFAAESPFQNGVPYRKNQQALTEGTQLNLNRGTLNRLRNNPRPTMLLVLPIAGGTPMKLELARVNVTTADFAVGTLGDNPQEDIEQEDGVHYRGVVQGVENSVASISVFDDEVMGMIATPQGNFVLGKLGDNSGDHILYKDNDLKEKSAFMCGVQDQATPRRGGRAGAGIGCKTITVYFECDYKLYTDKGSNVTNVTNYVTGLFNQVATLYQNENIDIQISQINVYTSADPYAAATTTNAALDLFQARVGTSFTGTLAHLLTTRNIGGGIAYLDVLCTKSYAFGVSAIYNNYATVPTYSWSVDVLAHELGHNLGSNHTQWCGWALPGGGTGALDNCYTTEGGCAPGPAPVNGGTIMSYCHLVSAGKNFALGFGQLPGNAMRQRVLEASCVASNGTAAAPTGLTATSVGSTTAAVAWVAVPNAAQYLVEYKLSSSTTWLNGGAPTTPSFVLTNLVTGDTYDWRVRSDCSGFSVAASFTTDGTFSCASPTNLASSNVGGSSATLSWAAVAGANTYILQYKPATSSTWTVVSNIFGTSWSVSGLQAGTTYNWQVRANCSGYAPIAAFTTTASRCNAPTGLSTTNLTTTSAQLNWVAVAGAGNYTVQYKLSSAKKWTTGPTVTTNSFTLSGLTRSSTYQWQVKANCSNYSGSVSFATPAALVGAKAAAGFALYPNPATDVVTLEAANAEEIGGAATYRVYDLKGTLRLTQRLDEASEQLNVSTLTTGQYIIQMTTKSGRTSSRTFVKE